MRKLIVSILLLTLIVACGQEGSNNNETENNTSSGENQQNGEETGENTEPVVGELDGENANEEESNEIEVESDPVTGTDASSILQKSVEAMSDVTSFKGVSEYIDDSTINGVADKTETTFTMEMIFSEPVEMHAVSTTVDSSEQEDTEMYVTNGNLYMFGDGMWYSMPTDSGYGSFYERFKILEDEQMAAYFENSEVFEVTDQGDHYLLSFSGDNEQYKNVVLGSSFGALTELFEEHYKNMEVRSGSYEISIAKDTFYVTNYKMEYDATTTGEVGTMDQYYMGTYSLSDFNAIDDITVPEEVVENAQSFGN